MSTLNVQKQFSETKRKLGILNLKKTLNRPILAGSVIVGITVMMSISMIAPAFAASPWKDLWGCVNSDDSVAHGTEEYLTDHEDCEIISAKMSICTPRGPSTDGHEVFLDKNRDNIRDIDSEKFRCVKN